MVDTTPLLSRKEAAAYLRKRNYRTSHTRLEVMAANNNAGKGPPFYKIGHAAMYDPADLDKWLEKRIRRVE